MSSSVPAPGRGFSNAMCLLVLIFLVLPVLGQTPAPAKPPAPPPPPPAHLSPAQDRERLLGLLRLKEADMRHPPASDPKAADATNYDESKARVYPNLPDPLLLAFTGDAHAHLKHHDDRVGDQADDITRQGERKGKNQNAEFTPRRGRECVQ